MQTLDVTSVHCILMIAEKMRHKTNYWIDKGRKIVNETSQSSGIQTQTIMGKKLVDSWSDSQIGCDTMPFGHRSLCYKRDTDTVTN